MVKYGEGNYYFSWDGTSPSKLQEEVKISTATLQAQINKEKARLAILQMNYRIQRKSTRYNCGHKTTIDIKIVDCVNESLIERLQIHFAKDRDLGKCVILQKKENIDMSPLSQEIKNIEERHKHKSRSFEETKSQ